MKMVPLTVALIFTLLMCASDVNGKPERPMEPPALDLHCKPIVQSWIQKTCEWRNPPHISTRTQGVEDCTQLCRVTDFCVSGRYDMWKGVCELSQEDCDNPVTPNSKIYSVAFKRISNNPQIPKDDCFIVRKEIGAGSNDGTPSFVQCRDGEVVTECDCQRGVRINDPPEGSCTGITISHSGTRCNAWGGTKAIPGHEGPRNWLVVARASCGRLVEREWTVTSYPETGFTSEPSVQCKNADDDTVLFGCYVNSDGSVEGFETERVMTQGVRDGSTCRAPPGCTACQVTAICAQGGFPGKWHGSSSGNCLCAGVVYGPWTENSEVSRVECSREEVVTSCDCEAEGGGDCHGALVDWDNQYARMKFHCAAFKVADGKNVRAKACCGKVGGSVTAVWDPPMGFWIRELQNTGPSTAPGRELPRARCPIGFDVIGCTWFSPDGNYVERFTANWSNLRRYGDNQLEHYCETYSGRCTNCIVSAICFRREPCKGTKPRSSGNFGPWTDCSSSAPARDVYKQTRQTFCDSPKYEDGWFTCNEQGRSHDVEERSCSLDFQPYLLVGVPGGIDRVNLPDGDHYRITRIPDGYGSVMKIACDLHAGYVFYISQIEDASGTRGVVLRRCSMTGENHQLLKSFAVGLVSTDYYGLVADTSGRQLWYSRNHFIERSDYNGANVQRVHDRAPWLVQALTFYAKYDRETQTWERRIFWAEINGESDRVMSSTFLGSDIHTVIPASQPARFGTLSMDGPNLYWADGRGDILFKDIHSTNLGRTAAVTEAGNFVNFDVHAAGVYVPGPVELIKVHLDELDESGWISKISIVTRYGVQSLVVVHDKQTPANGKWATWGPWTECTATCDWYGIRGRLRTCDDPPALLPGLSQGCVGWDHHLEGCNRKNCDDYFDIISEETANERKRLTICGLYVDNDSLVGVESTLPESKTHAETLPSCTTTCTDRGMTCADSLRVYDLEHALRKGFKQVKKMSCNSKWSTLCCCV